MISLLGLGACQQEEESIVKQEDISRETLDKIYQMGFGTADVKKIEEGYLVEGDILLTEEQLSAHHSTSFLRVGETEQYRTTNLVQALPRTIRVSLSSGFSSAYSKALNDALARFNARNLLITFQRVSKNGDIHITKSLANASYLAAAGFPSSTGNPYGSVIVNAAYLGGNPNRAYLATILAHEIGHCIGFRHTDYMDRSYSCGGTRSNEGASSVGAINIPGTPTTADAGSWMLACIGGGENRPFNSNDITALNYLY
ncbi:MAG: M57 family metalloprotease [Adhaeribacter sp.]